MALFQWFSRHFGIAIGSTAIDNSPTPIKARRGANEDALSHTVRVCPDGHWSGKKVGIQVA
jgi:hypothetical protein